MASGRLTISARDAGSEILLAYKGSGKKANGRLADTGSDQKTAIPYYAVGIVLIILGGYFAMRSKKGFLAVLVVAGVGVSGYFSNTASAIITSIGSSEVISLKDGEEITYTPAAIDGYQYAGCVKLVNGVPVPMTPDNPPAPSNPSTPPVTPPITPPAPAVPGAAANNGFTRLAFEDDFTSISTIDTGNTGAPGFKWYPAGVHKWGKPDTQPSEYSVNNSVLRIAPSHSTYNRNFMTRDPNTGEGQSFGRGYYEVRMRVDADGVRNVPPENSSWPAFWAQSNHLHRLNQRPYVELDMVEIMRKDEFLGTLWAHHGGQFDKSLMIKNRKADYRNPNYHSADWHTYGCLWDTNGVEWYIDGVLVLKQYWGEKRNLLAPNDPQQNPVAADGTNPTLSNPFGLFDSETAIDVILGTGKTWPMEVDWDRIWQHP